MPARVRAPRMATLAAAALVVVACTTADTPTTRAEPPAATGTATTPVPTSTAPPPVGGVVRMVVPDDADPDAPTLAGAVARELVHHRLFTVTPDGTAEPSVVQAGSVTEAADGSRVSFRIRTDARWSDGTPVTVDDVRRSADPRLVAEVEAAADGTVTLRFTHPVAGWRTLWSPTGTVVPPAAGVWGGPWVLVDIEDGHRARFEPNPGWWGPGPHLEALELVVVPDPLMVLATLEAGLVDVAAPLPANHRRADLAAIGGLGVLDAPGSGYTMVLHLNAARLGGAARRAATGLVDRDLFVGTLLKGEATVATGLDPARPTGAWDGFRGGDPAGLGDLAPEVIGADEEPMVGLLHRAMQRAAADAGARLRVRTAEASIAEGWLADGDFDLATMTVFDGPAVCWTCRWGHVDATLAAAADAGDPGAVEALEARLRDEAVVVPLWRGDTVVAHRAGVHGVVPNPWARSPAWSAHTWWVG